MPPVVVAVVAAAGASLLFNATFLVAASIALSAYSVASALGQKLPSIPSYSQQIRERKIMVRSPNQTRSRVYGEVKVSGPLIFASVTGDDNEFVHLVIPLASHEVNSIGAVYFNDKLVSFYDQFERSDQIVVYYNNLATSFDVSIDGAPRTGVTAQALSDAITANGGGNIVSTISSISSNGISMSKVTISDVSTGGDGFVISDATYTLAGVVTEAKFDRLDSTYFPYRITKHLGTDTQSADPDLVSEVPEWTSAHQLKGIAYLYVRLNWNDKVWLTGIPNVSAVIQGAKVLDPRTSTTAYSTNWALNLADYLKHEDGFGASSTEIDDASIITAANASDEQVQLTASPDTFQNRYELQGVVNLNVSPRNNLDAMIGGGAGSVIYTQGVFRLFAGVYSSPVRTLTIDDLAGPIKVRAKASRADAFNAVKGTFADPDNFFEAQDFPVVTNTLYEAQDGEQIFADIELGFTTNITMAQRLAKIMLEKSRQGITLNFPANLSALELAVNDTVRVDIGLLGWGTVDASNILLEDGSNLLLENGDALLTELAGGKQFKVVEWSLASKGNINLTLIEEASAIYDWNMGNETFIDIAPNTALPDPFTVNPPSAISIISGDDELLVNSDGTILSRMLIRWTPPTDAFIVAYDIAWKKATDAKWINTKTVLTEFYASGVEDLTLYDIKVRAINSIGVASSYLETTHTVIGKSAPPPDVDSFLVRAMGDGTREFTWIFNDQPPDHAGFKIRWKTGSGGTWATMADLHTGLLLASPFESNQLAAGAYTFGIKAVDTSGNESTNAKIIEFTLPDPRIAGALEFLDIKSLSWPGTLTDAWISEDGDIHAKDQKTWADFALDGVDWANWTTWARNPFTTISYEHPFIDVGIKTKFIPLVSVVTDAATILIEESHSDDNISYTPFATLGAGEVDTRYIKLKVTVTDVINNPATIETITITLSATQLEEDIEDLDISTLTGANRIAVGHVKLPIQNSYAIVRRVDLVLQNVGSGFTWELISKADLVNGPEIKIYNGSGALTDATIDATIRGL